MTVTTALAIAAVSGAFLYLIARLRIAENQIHNFGVIIAIISEETNVVDPVLKRLEELRRND